MSFLRDFAAGFINDQARQMQQAEQLSIAEAIEERRRQRALEDEKRQRQWKKEDQVDVLNAQAQPTAGYDAEGNVSLLRPKFDLQDGRLRRTDEKLGKPLLRPEGKPYRQTEGDEVVTYRDYSDGVNIEQREVARGPRYKPNSGGGGSGRTTVPRDERGFTPAEAERFKREDAARIEAAVGKDVDAARKVLDKLKPDDWKPGPDGYVKAGQVLEAELGLPRGIRTKAEALKAVEQAARESRAPQAPPEDLDAARAILRADPSMRDEIVRRLRDAGYSTRGL